MDSRNLPKLPNRPLSVAPLLNDSDRTGADFSGASSYQGGAMHFRIAQSWKRSSWGERIRNLLMGVLTEYTKHKSSELMELTQIPQFNWEKEIAKLLNVIETFMDPKKTPTSTKFDRGKSFREFALEASTDYQSLLEGRNKFEKYMESEYPTRKMEYMKKFKLADWDAETLFLEMLERYSPNLFKVVTQNTP